MVDSNIEESGLRRSDLDPNPFKQFEKWFDEAQASVPKLPNTMTLATADRDGRPSARMVLLKGFDERGFVFYTNYESQKSEELEENPQAALVFYWVELDRQVRITGRVSKVSREESAEYFRTRPADSRLAAWASKQSEVIENREVLETRMKEFEARYPGEAIPLPPFWGGFCLSPDTIEFWQNRPSRLHDRFRYTLQPDSSWLIERLSP
ncbi:MAG: pyridoxamine 5'-phosphate oxidase [Blastocatellia bacterium]|nr:pyridoxamine 5'-phosphate oxidase [Blastocatellia bacterium]